MTSEGLDVSDTRIDPDMDEFQSYEDPALPTHLLGSHPSLLEDVERRDPEHFSDEGLLPELPAFMGLFPPNIFKSLLFKATNVAHLTSLASEPVSTTSRGAADMLFSEPDRVADTIPAPCLFVDVVNGRGHLQGQPHSLHPWTNNTSMWGQNWRQSYRPHQSILLSLLPCRPHSSGTTGRKFATR